MSEKSLYVENWTRLYKHYVEPSGFPWLTQSRDLDFFLNRRKKWQKFKTVCFGWKYLRKRLEKCVINIRYIYQKLFFSLPEIPPRFWPPPPPRNEYIRPKIGSCRPRYQSWFKEVAPWRHTVTAKNTYKKQNVKIFKTLCMIGKKLSYHQGFEPPSPLEIGSWRPRFQWQCLKHWLFGGIPSRQDTVSHNKMWKSWRHFVW